MRLLNFPKRNVLQNEIRTDRLSLTRPLMNDFGQWASLREISRNHLQPFEPKWSTDELMRSSFKSRLRQVDADHNSGRGVHWFLKLTAQQSDLIGGIAFSNIRRGVAQTGTLGYWMGAPHVCNGYMREALNAVCRHGFKTLGLHRLEAATIIDNHRSQRLLAACGFQEEGRARAYLKINGEWKDHILFSRLSTDSSANGR